MTELKPYYVPSSASSKSTTKRSNNGQSTNYETLLSHFNNKNVSKLAKATSAFQGDKQYIQSLQSQIQELKEQVNYLSQENKRLLLIEDRSLIVITFINQKIKQQYEKLTKFSDVLQIVQQLKIENAALRQNIQSLKIDFNIQILPLKKLLSHLVSIPKINDVIQMRVEQQECQISQLKNKCEILNIERTNLLEQVFKQEEVLITAQQQLLNK